MAFFLKQEKLEKRKTECFSKFLYLSHTFEKNSLIPDRYINTKVEAPSTSTMAISSILTIISGPANSMTMITAKACQNPLTSLFLSYQTPNFLVKLTSSDVAA
ncbi:hypothetical protein P4S68_02970 [Pseudoalteromonas sp. Hal099]